MKSLVLGKPRWEYVKGFPSSGREKLIHSSFFLQHSLLFPSLPPARAIKSLSLRNQAILPRLASPQGRERDRERPFTSRGKKGQYPTGLYTRILCGKLEDVFGLKVCFDQAREEGRNFSAGSFRLFLADTLVPTHP